MKLAIPVAVAIAGLVSAAASGTSPRPTPKIFEPDRAPRDAPDLERPLAWLVAAQNQDGSWGAEVHSQSPDVATTAIAGIALLRLGHTGSQGEFQARTRRAVDYVVAAVERAPENEIAVQEPGTLPQRKLGRNVDTYVAAQFLAEALPTLPREQKTRAERAL